LVSALFAEGESDHLFLGPLLPRILEALLLQVGIVVDVQPVQRLTAISDARGRADRIVRAVAPLLDAIHLLFIHTDGGGDAPRARSDKVDPAANMIKEQFTAEAPAMVGIVPVRETEAWVLAGELALREAAGTGLSPEAIGGSWSPRELERLTDPKRVLDKLVASERRAGRRHARAVARFDQIARTCDINRLRELSAFAAFERELREALVDLGYRALADG